MGQRFTYRTVVLVFILLTTVSLHACRSSTRHDVTFGNQTFTLLLPRTYWIQQPNANQCPPYSFLGGDVVAMSSGAQCYEFQLYPTTPEEDSDTNSDRCCGVLQVYVTQLTNSPITSASDAVQKTWQSYSSMFTPDSPSQLIPLPTEASNRLAFTIDYDDTRLPGEPIYVDLIQHMAVFHKDNDKLTVLWASKIVYTATDVDEELEAIGDSFRPVDR